MRKAPLTFQPLTASRWGDLEALFGARGACGGCWCMWWRLTQKQFEKNKGERNRRAIKALIKEGAVPGILVYRDDHPIGWCAIEPRENFLRLGTSRILKPVDEQPVWSVVCLFVAKESRNQGVSVKLLKAAVKHVKEQGGRFVEGYPVEPRNTQPDAWVWTGLASAYLKAGFTEVARRSPRRPIMRRRAR